MQNFKTAIITTIAFSVAGWTTLTFAQPVMTEKQCGDPKIFDVLSKQPNDCKRERVHATGGMRPIDSFAKGSAEKEWRREVLTKYGERYQNIQKGVCRTTECVQAAISGMTRCSVSAIPCAVKPTFEGGGPVPAANAAAHTAVLSVDETKEVQRLLKVEPDGDFGKVSITKLRAFQRSQKLEETNVPTREILERLRSASK